MDTRLIPVQDLAPDDIIVVNFQPHTVERIVEFAKDVYTVRLGDGTIMRWLRDDMVTIEHKVDEEW